MSKTFNEYVLGMIEMDPPEALAQIARVNPARLGEVRRELEGIAEWTTWLARYVEEREGFGCGDQGHQKALASANKAGRVLWCKAFGYNAFIPRNPAEPKGASKP